MKKITLYILIATLILTGCQAGSVNSSLPTLTQYPPTGLYTGYAQSNVTGQYTIFSGNISGGEGMFNTVNVELGQGVLSGAFALYNFTCFNGIESYAENDLVNNWTLTNCAIIGDDFTASYVTGAGDNGVLTLKPSLN